MDAADLSFLGTGWAFPPEFTTDPLNGGPGALMLSGNDDIQNSLFLIFSTALGERVMRPTFGADLSSFVFESISVQSLTLIKSMITEAIIYHEPRIKLESVTLNTQTNTIGMIEIILVYAVISINTRYNYVYPFYIQEAVNLTQ